MASKFFSQNLAIDLITSGNLKIAFLRTEDIGSEGNLDLAEHKVDDVQTVD